MQLYFSKPDTGAKVTYLYQWDTNVNAEFSLPESSTAIEAVFSTIGMKEGIRKNCTYSDGKWTVNVPDKVLIHGTNVSAYITYVDAESRRTVEECIITIRKSAKPEGYVSKDESAYASTDEMIRLATKAKEDAILAKEQTTKAKEDAILAKEQTEKLLEEFSGIPEDVATLKQDFENHISNHPSGDGSGGVNGKDGVGILSVEQTTISTDDGGINVVTVTKTDSTTSNFQIRNGSKGNKGDTGEKGDKGESGIDGITPTIGDNGNWYLGDNDTGKPSRGEQGIQGPKGETGERGINGADGKSAYEIAVDNGFSGTETEWLESLKGEKGDTQIGSGLIVTDDGRLSVDTVNTVEENNMKPITSDAVYKVIGNIETALAAI